MDYVQIAIIVGLVALGGAIVYWPMSLMVKHLDERVERMARELEALKQDAKNLVTASQGVVDEERLIDRAGGLTPGDRFGGLLDGDLDPTAPAGGTA